MSWRYGSTGINGTAQELVARLSYKCFRPANFNHGPEPNSGTVTPRSVMGSLTGCDSRREQYRLGRSSDAQGIKVEFEPQVLERPDAIVT